MADQTKATDGLSPFAPEAFNPKLLPEFDDEFITPDELARFEHALAAPDTSPVTALNDWRPIHQRVRKRGSKHGKPRSKKKTRRIVGRNKAMIGMYIVENPFQTRAASGRDCFQGRRYSGLGG